MTKDVEQAIQYLDNLCGSMQLPRAGHVSVQEAFNIIKQAIEKPKKAPIE